MSTDRLLSLAAGVLPEFPPDVIARSAALAGYPATGIWCDADTWTDATTRAVADVLTEHRLIALDIEVIWIRSGTEPSDAARRLIEAGGALGARNVLIVSVHPDATAATHQFAALCELAQQAGMRAVLEFLMITEVKSLAQALSIVQAAGHPAGGVLIDALHFDRCGASAADVRALDPKLLPYAQLCDGPASVERKDYQGYLTDAIDARSIPGEGALPLDELVRALPRDLPLSLEVRSQALRERHADPVERARVVLDGTRRWLEARLADSRR
ncbi:MAG TPA: TIM barrel protein [Pseudomonadales bacterium]